MDLSAGLLPAVSQILRIASLALVVLLGANALLVPPKPTAVGIDQVVYSLTHEQMRDGHDYYTAMTEGLTRVYGPPVAVRDFRFPTLFLLLERVPQTGLWAAFVAMATVAGLVAVWGSPGGLVGPLVSSYILGIGRADTGLGVTDQFLTVELWVAPLILLSVVALLANRPGIAAVVALAGFSIREHVALLLASALVFAWIRGKKHLVLAASGVGGLLTAIHIGMARRHIAASGSHTSFDQGLDPGASFLNTVGFGFAPPLLGVVLWLLAWVVVIRLHHVATLGPFLALPLLAFFVDRPYWGILIVPLTMLVGIQAIPGIVRGVPRLFGGRH